MLEIFSKKHFLVDLLDGYIDIHNHILPGIDDGAKTPEDSLAILNEFKEFGVTDFICTPHIMGNYYPNNPQTIRNSHALLQNQLLINNIKDFSIEIGAEHMIDDQFQEALYYHEVVPLNNNHILIEMSFLQPSINFEECVHQIKCESYFPILAHPERYVFLHNKTDKHRAYKEQGIFYQLNLLSLSPYYGAEVQKMALKLLERKMFDFIGTDVHSLKQIQYLKEVKLPEKTLNLLKSIVEKTVYSFK